MNQLAIEFAGLARTSDPVTSHDAAARIDARGLADLVHRELQRNGPATSHEVADRLGLSLVTASPRMKPLETAGRVVRDGRRDRRTVWRAT